MLRRMTFCLFFLVALAAPASASESQTEQRDLDKYPLRFAVIGDRTGETQPGIYEQIVAEIERLKPEFVITVGDMIEGYSPDTLPTPQRWEEYLSIVDELSMPIYYTPGNNDIVTDDLVEAYRKYTGCETYYSFDRDGVHFVILDNSRWGLVQQFPAEQLEWLAKDLEAHGDAKFSLVFFHQPFWYRTIADSKPDTLHSIFTTYGVDAVFSGHFHRYFTGEFDGVIYTNMGTSGGHTNPMPGDPEYHFAWVTITGKDINIAPVKLGAVLPWDEVEVKDIRYFEKSKRLGISFIDEAVVSEPSLDVKSSAVRVELSNLHGSLVMQDTVSWTVPDGWSVSPSRLAVTVAPGASEKVSFELSCSGPLYPLPELNVNFPYRAEGGCPASRQLRIAREASCRKTDTQPAIDGELDEEIWQKPRAGLLAQDGGAATIDSTEFYFAYDAQNLYLAARCFDQNMDSLQAEMSEQDDEVFREDCVGYLYRPFSVDDAVYQLYVNPLGTVYDQKIERGSDGYWSGNNSWNGTYETATKKLNNCWQVEVRVPLAQFGADGRSGQRWDFNFRRKQFRLDSSGGWQVPHAYDPNGFGKLILQ